MTTQTTLSLPSRLVAFIVRDWLWLIGRRIATNHRQKSSPGLLLPHPVRPGRLPHPGFCELHLLDIPPPAGVTTNHGTPGGHFSCIRTTAGYNRACPLQFLAVRLPLYGTPRNCNGFFVEPTIDLLLAIPLR